MAIVPESFSPLNLDYTTSLVKVQTRSDAKTMWCYSLSKLEQTAWTGLNWPQPMKVDTDVILRHKYDVSATKLNTDTSSGAQKLHCYWDILRFYQILVICLSSSKWPRSDIYFEKGQKLQPLHDTNLLHAAQSYT